MEKTNGLCTKHFIAHSWSKDILSLLRNDQCLLFFLCFFEGDLLLDLLFFRELDLSSELELRLRLLRLLFLSRDRDLDLDLEELELLLDRLDFFLELRLLDLLVYSSSSVSVLSSPTLPYLEEYLGVREPCEVASGVRSSSRALIFNSFLRN